MSYSRICQNPACNKPFRASDPTGQCCSWSCAGIVAQARMPIRFWAKVQQCPHGDFCPFCCWPWTASTNPAGYGNIGVKEGGEWSTRLSHTVAWELINQRSVPDGLQINHHCDNPPCCSIWHIYAGTQSQNTVDMTHRGRVARGEARSNLTTEAVVLIRSLYRQGVPMVELAQEFGKSQPVLSAMISGKTWAHVPGVLSPEERRLIMLARKRVVTSTRKTTVLTEDDVRTIRTLFQQGIKYAPLATQFGVSRSHIRAIVKGRTRKHLL